MSLLCKLGIHKFDEWQNVGDEGIFKCQEQVRICKRDGYEEKRTSHKTSYYRKVLDSGRDKRSGYSGAGCGNWERYESWEKCNCGKVDRYCGEYTDTDVPSN